MAPTSVRIADRMEMMRKTSDENAIPADRGQRAAAASGARRIREAPARAAPAFATPWRSVHTRDGTANGRRIAPLVRQSRSNVVVVG
jgi:hypothetical protein